MRGSTEVRYLVIPDRARPQLLARVRWPDIAEAISAGQPQWHEDPGLFDLPYDPGSALVSQAEAVAIAADWGSSLPGPAAAASRTVVRRMPANWSDPAPVDRRTWWLDEPEAPSSGRTVRRQRRPARLHQRVTGLASLRWSGHSWSGLSWSGFRPRHRRVPAPAPAPLPAAPWFALQGTELPGPAVKGRPRVSGVAEPASDAATGLLDAFPGLAGLAMRRQPDPPAEMAAGAGRRVGDGRSPQVPATWRTPSVAVLVGGPEADDPALA